MCALLRDWQLRVKVWFSFHAGFVLAALNGFVTSEQIAFSLALHFHPVTGNMGAVTLPSQSELPGSSRNRLCTSNRNVFIQNQKRKGLNTGLPPPHQWGLSPSLASFPCADLHFFQSSQL